MVFPLHRPSRHAIRRHCILQYTHNSLIRQLHNIGKMETIRPARMRNLAQRDALIHLISDTGRDVWVENGGFFGTFLTMLAAWYRILLLGEKAGRRACVGSA